MLLKDTFQNKMLTNLKITEYVFLANILKYIDKY